LKTYLLAITGRLVSFLPESRCYRLKALVYNLCGEHIDLSAHIYSSVVFATLPVYIGRDTHIGPRCLFAGDIGCPIVIGPNCAIAPLVTFITGTHKIGSPTRRAGRGYSLPIEVGAGTWIGAGSLILPGVTIGRGCVIAGGSVVTKGIPANTLAAGVPAVVKKQLSDDGGSDDGV
jgi:maltose O-acetyltransferase